MNSIMTIIKLIVHEIVKIIKTHWNKFDLNLCLRGTKDDAALNMSSIFFKRCFDQFENVPRETST